MKARISLIILFLMSLAVIMPFTQPAWASNISQANWVATLRITNNGTATTLVATNFSLSTAQLIAGNYLFSNAANSALLTNGGSDTAYMPAVGSNTAWIAWVPSINQNENLDYFLYTGGNLNMSGKIRYFPGTDGMTTVDNSSLELGNNYSFTQSGYIDTSQIGSNLAVKAEAYRMFILSTGNVAMEILSYTSQDNNPYGGTAANVATTNWFAQTFLATSGYHIGRIKLIAGKRLSPAGDLTVSLRAVNASNYPTGADLASASIPASNVAYETNVPFNYTVTNTSKYAIVVRALSANASDYPVWYFNNDTVDRYTSGNKSSSTDSGVNWAVPSAVDDFIFYIYSTPYVSTAPTSSTETVNSSASDSFIRNSGAVYATVQSAASGDYNNPASIYLTNGQYLDTGTYYVYRSAIYFDSSSIPSFATITTAKLRLYSKYVRTTGNDYYVTVQNGQPTYPHDPVQNADFDKTFYGTATGGSKLASTFADDTYGELNLDATGIGWINKGSATKFILRSNRDIAGTAPVGDEYIEFNSTDSGNPPQLVVTYSTGASVTSGEHTITNALAGNTATISIDGSILGSVSTTASVPNNGNIWTFIPDNVMPYMATHNITISGVLKQSISWINSGIFTDASGNGNDAIPSFRTASSDNDVTGTILTFIPVSQATAILTSNLGSVNMITSAPSAIPQMYTEDYAKLPGADYVNANLDANNIPRALWWIPFPLMLVVLLGMFTYDKTKSLLFQYIIILISMAFFAMVGPLPFWVVVLFGFDGMAFLVASKQYGW